MRVIYQLIEKDTGSRCEPMAVEFSNLQRILSDYLPESEREKYYVLLLMEERGLQDHDDLTADRMTFSQCPLMLVSSFVALGANKNVA